MYAAKNCLYAMTDNPCSVCGTESDNNQYAELLRCVDCNNLFCDNHVMEIMAYGVDRYDAELLCKKCTIKRDY